MNDVSRITDFVKSKFPDAMINVEVGNNGAGTTWIDIERCGQVITIEWRPNAGFGLYHRSEEAGLGFGPDEVHRELALLLSRLELLVSRMGIDITKAKRPGEISSTANEHQIERASSFGQMTLKDIRELLGVTQAQIASALGKQQSAISKIEQREDMLISTLVSVIHSLGGSVEIRAHFKSCDLPIYTNGRIAPIQPHPNILSEHEGEA